MKFRVETESQLGQVIPQLWDAISGQAIVLFRGDLGAGKTTTIKALGDYIGIENEMSSPSFGIVNEYQCKGETVYHIDLYRIKNVEEVYEFGLPEILDSGAVCFIEWPEMVEEIWQDYDHSTVAITIEKSCVRSIFVS